MNKKLLIIVFFLIGISGDSFGQFNKAGRTSIQFLKIGIGARQSAMGEANIASVRDINAVFWNPALITGIGNIEAGFNYTKWIGDLNIMSGTAGINLGNFGTVALNYITLDYGDINEALVTSPTGGNDTRTGNTFTGNDLAFGIAYARAFTDRLSIGLNFKYIQEKLFVYSASLWAFDVGSYYDTGWRGIKIGMAAQNFSSSARWLETRAEEQQSFEIPTVYRIGASVDLMGGEHLFLGGDPAQHRITLNMDAIHTNDYAERLHLGLEYWLYNLVALRGGYRMNYEEGNLSAGIGINYDTGLVHLKIDYAYVQYDFLDSPHRLSIIMMF
jgi:hypothetical protein